MIYQSRAYSCGPASLHNATNFLYGSKAPSEDVFREQAAEFGAGVDGTSVHAMKRTLKNLNIPFYTFSERHLSKGWNNLLGALWDEKLLITCSGRRNHWSVVLGFHGLWHLVVLDSAHEDIIQRVHINEFKEDWEGEKGSRVFAIAIG